MKIKFPSKNVLLYSVLLTAIVLCCVLQGIALAKVKAVFKSVEGGEPPTVEVFATQISGDAIFLLRECGGKIGVFDAKSDILVDIIDVFAASLPAADRKALQQGVEIRSFAELATVIEDLST